ncbi:MAG: MarC family protein [Bacteroidales bacterium]|nr:MarC family protein [Bacteroidales bacterium]
MLEALGSFSFSEVLSAFLVLFAVIDITGAVPVVLNLKASGKKIEPLKTALISFVLFMLFLFVGIQLLGFFGVDIKSFAVAGSIILFVLAAEMVFGVTLFKEDCDAEHTTALVPLVFPLIAGAASFTTLLSLRAEYQLINIIIAVILNMVVVYVVLRNVSLVEKLIGKGGVYILKKIFGIILLAIATRLFVENFASLYNMLINQ